MDRRWWLVERNEGDESSLSDEQKEDTDDPTETDRELVKRTEEDEPVETFFGIVSFKFVDWKSF
jgi:hypothetical protein